MYMYVYVYYNFKYVCTYNIAFRPDFSGFLISICTCISACICEYY